MDHFLFRKLGVVVYWNIKKYKIFPNRSNILILVNMGSSLFLVSAVSSIGFHRKVPTSKL